MADDTHIKVDTKNILHIIKERERWKERIKYLKERITEIEDEIRLYEKRRKELLTVLSDTISSDSTNASTPKDESQGYGNIQ